MARSSHSRMSFFALALIAATVLGLLVPVVASANTLKLIPEKTIPTARTPYGLAKGDVNNDGLMDLLVSNYGAGTVTLYYQVPAGGFSTGSKVDFSLANLLSPVPKPAGVAIGDVDGDGHKDIVAADTASQFIHLWTQPTTGTFAPAAWAYPATNGYMWPIHQALNWIISDQPSLPVGANPWSNGYQVAVRNFYGDATEEIVAPGFYSLDGGSSDRGGGYMAEWRGGRLRDGWRRGSATDCEAFYTPADFGPRNPLAMVTGYFSLNDPGTPSVMWIGDNGTANYASYAPPSWGMEKKIDIATVGGPVRAASGDINADGLDDVVVTGRSGTGSWATILQDDLGRLGGVPPVSQVHDSDAYPVGVRIADINNDGLNDIVFANARWDEVRGGLGVVPQFETSDTARGSKSPLNLPVREWRVGRYPEDVEVADWDNDGMNEVVIANSNSNSLMFFDQVLPSPPGVDVVGGGGPTSSSTRRVLSSVHAAVGAKATILWLSTTRPVIQLTEPSPQDLNGVVGYFYVVDQNANTAPTVASNYVATGTALTLGPLTGGTWFLHALSQDRRGNLGTEVSHFQLNIDVSAPTTPTVSDGFNGAWSDSDVRNVSFHATDTGAGIKDYLWAVDGATETATNATSAALSNLADGEHVFSVRGRDAAAPQNVGPAGTIAVRVDRFGPSCIITQPTTEGALVSRDMAVSVSASDTAGIKKVEFFVDGVLKSTKTSAPYTATVSTAGLASGSHTLLVRASDMFGHTKDATRLVKVDSIAPRITKVTLKPNPFFPLKRDGYKDNMFIKFRLSERATVRMFLYNTAGSLVGYRSPIVHSAGNNSVKWNGKLTSGSGTSRTTVSLKEGTYKLKITAFDAAGNGTSTKRYTVMIRKYVVVLLSGSRVKLVAH